MVPVSKEPMESVVQSARSMPSDIKGCLATFGSSETVHRRLQSAVNEQIRGLRGNLETRNSIIAASDEILRRTGIDPKSRRWLTNLIWEETVGFAAH